MSTIVKVLMIISILTECQTEIDSHFLGIHEIRYDVLEKAASNSSNTSNPCHFQISGSSLKDVVRLMRDSTTNVIKLNVWTGLAENDTTNNNQTLMTNFQWANEVGRTLYSLILGNNENVTSLISSMSTVTLTAGVNNVDILVNTENERCMLLAKTNASKNLLFNLFLRKLHRVSDDDAHYRLCRSNELTLECCTMRKVGTEEVPLCSDYSSNVIKSFSIILFAMVFCFIYYAFPLFLDYTNRFKEESEYYMISNSPMALSFIMRTAFIEGHGPLKSFLRRLLLVSFVIAAILPIPNLVITNNNTLFLYILVCPWAFIFLFSDGHKFNESGSHASVWFSFFKPDYKNLIELISLPFNLKFWWHKYSKFVMSCCYEGNRQRQNGPEHNPNVKIENESEASTNVSITSEHNPLVTEPGGLTNVLRADYGSVQSISQPSEVDDEISKFKRTFRQFIELLMLRIYFLILVIVYLAIVFPLSSAYVLFTIAFKSYLSNPFEKCDKCGRSCGNLPIIAIKWLLSIWKSYIVGLSLIVLCSTYFFGFILYFAIGLFLNGETYGPYLVPLSTIFFYSWINWKLSVEAQYSLLNTAIYEVCNERSPSVRATNEGSPSIRATNESSPSVCATNESSPSVCATNESSPSVCATNESSPSVCATNESSSSVCATNESSPSVRVTHGVLPAERGETSNNDFETNNNNHNDNNDSTSNSFVIKLDDDGEPIIPRNLYNLAREKLLPYDQVLFHYFSGVLIIIAFSYFLYVLMSLSQQSGVSGSVQVIGSIVATTLPIIFNLVWKQSSVEQKAADKIAIKSKLKRILMVRRRSNDPEEIEVEFKNENQPAQLGGANDHSV